MRLAAAELIQAPSTQREPGATLDMVTSWLAEQRKDQAPLIMEAEVVDHCSPAHSRRESLWQALSLVGSPSLWPAAMEALWLGEPVWPYLQRQGEWFQVVEAVLLELASGQILAQAASPWRPGAVDEPTLQVPLAGGAVSVAAAESDRQVTVLVGRQSRLTVRVLGHPPAELRQALQAICFEADALLEEPMAATLNKPRLLLPLVQKALFRAGPKAAPWNRRAATRALVLLGLGVVGMIAWAAQQEIEWQRDLAQLDAEPGIKVTASWPRWGIREIEGLRDLRAADPAAVLRRHGQMLEHADVRLDTVVYQESLTAVKP